MRFQAFVAILFVAPNAVAETPASRLLTELKAKRDALPSLHQEFEVSQTSKSAHGSQSLKREIVLDMCQEKWRERSVTGSGNYIRIFDGKDLLWTEEGGNEYVRTKRGSKAEGPVPSPYRFSDADWSKAVEAERRPCGIAGSNHLCVILDVPLKPWTRMNTVNDMSKMVEGTERLVVDGETGLVVLSRRVQVIQRLSTSYRSDVTYTLKRVSYGAPADVSLFKLPSSDMREVKELSRWNAAKMKKELSGKPAPELAVTDLQGKTITLAALKGRTVLLDFWTTWCPPCRADGPALEKLYQKYGDKELMIVGISVSEDRAIVEKFLIEHPHNYPVVLTTENELPRPYQVGVFPTYIVIDSDGRLSAAVEGDKGFGELRKLLRKAGLESE